MCEFMGIKTVIGEQKHNTGFESQQANLSRVFPLPKLPDFPTINLSQYRKINSEERKKRDILKKTII
jgi:hypothetical protein